MFEPCHMDEVEFHTPPRESKSKRWLSFHPFSGVYIYICIYIWHIYIYAQAHKNIHKSDELTQLPTDCGRSYIAWTSSETKMQIWKHSDGLWMSWLRMGRMGPWSTHAMDIRPAGPQMGWPRGLLGFGGADSMIQHHVVNSISMLVFDDVWCLMMFDDVSSMKRSSAKSASARFWATRWPWSTSSLAGRVPVAASGALKCWDLTMICMDFDQ